MFTEAQKTDIRRFCGYPAYGASASGFTSWRFFQAYGLIEYRLLNLSAAEEAVVTTTYLPNLATLETAIPAAGALIGIDQAAVFKRNPNEVRERQGLFGDWRRRLCDFLGIPPGPNMGSGGLTLVV